MLTRSENRQTAAQRGYDKDWFSLRARFLRSNPTCVTPGCNTKASHVDHIRSVREFPELRLAVSNLRSLCTSCHNRRTRTDQQVAEGRVLDACDANGMPLDPRHPWNNGGSFKAAKRNLADYGLSFDSIAGRFVRR